MPHGENLLVVGGPHSVFILQEGDRVGDIAVQVQDDAPLADVGLEHGPGLRGLNDAAARGDDKALPVGFDGLAGVYGLPAAELGPSVLVHELLDRHPGLLGLEVVVQVQKLHVELLCHDVGHGGLATGTHSDQDDGPVGIRRRHRSCRGLLPGLAAVEMHAELGMQHVPPAGPGLGRAAAVLDDHGGPAHSGKQGQAHGSNTPLIEQASNPLLSKNTNSETKMQTSNQPKGDCNGFLIHPCGISRIYNEN